MYIALSILKIIIVMKKSKQKNHYDQFTMNVFLSHPDYTFLYFLCQVRKLDFLFADAIKQGCTSVITAGAFTSNHCRSTAIFARRLGMDVHIMLKTDKVKICCC